MTAPEGSRHTSESVQPCRHSECDGSEPASTCGNVRCDGCDGNRSCDGIGRSGHADTPHPGVENGAVTGYREISFPGSDFKVRVPVEPPVLTPRMARILLAMLVDATDLPVLDDPRERSRREC